MCRQGRTVELYGTLVLPRVRLSLHHPVNRPLNVPFLIDARQLSAREHAARRGSARSIRTYFPNLTTGNGSTAPRGSKLQQVFGNSEPRQLCQVHEFRDVRLRSGSSSLIRDRAHVRAAFGASSAPVRIDSDSPHFTTWSVESSKWFSFQRSAFRKSALLPSRRPLFTLQHVERALCSHSTTVERGYLGMVGPPWGCPWVG